MLRSMRRTGRAQGVRPDVTQVFDIGSTRLAGLAARVIEAHGGVADHAQFSEFDAPSYDMDIQDSSGFPAGADRFKQRLEAADGFIIASPEYNFSMPCGLKNAIDWVSRYRPQQPLKGMHGLLMSASPSMAGGNRGLWALRVPLEHLGAHVYPDMFSLAQARSAFTDDGQLANEKLQQLFEIARPK